MHCKGTRKGQSSLEQLIIVSIGLTFIAAIFYLALNMSNDNIRISQAQDMVEKLAKSADYVYSLGPGSKDVIDVFVPEGIVFTNISNHTIHVRLSLSSGYSDVYADTKPSLTGELPRIPGPREIPVMYTESGKVMLGDSLLACSPIVITKTFMQGENGTDSITVTNVGNIMLENISGTQDGNLGDIMIITQPASTLDEGESSIAGLTFTVPSDKVPGSYSGFVTFRGEPVNDTDKETECSTIVTVFVKSPDPPDDMGPIVITMSNSPRNPSIHSRVKIKATGDDSSTGGSVVINCQMELDGSGIWNDMEPIDGAYDEVKEGVTFSVGPLAEGDHFATVRCIDEYMNVGPERIENFTVRFYIKEILFITMDSAPSAEEQLWIDWIDTHSSGEGLAWNYDIVPKIDITSGTVDPGNYQVVAFADYPNTDTALDGIMITYRNTAHYIILLGTAMKFGIPNLDVGTGNAGSHARDSLKVQTDHYVTDGYTIWEVYNLTSGDFNIHYHPSFDAMNIMSMEDSDIRISVGDASFVIAYGPTRPDMFVTDGELFARRVIDHAILGS